MSSSDLEEQSLLKVPEEVPAEVMPMASFTHHSPGKRSPQEFAVEIVPLNPKSPRLVPKSSAVEEQVAKDTYRVDTVLDLVRLRWAWLLLFFGGLMLAAFVVEEFQNLLVANVELSYFVPLLIGHGGNSGAQSNATIIRALALGSVRPKDFLLVCWKEGFAGALMGGILGLLVMAVSLLFSGLSTRVGVTVAIALPVVSMWANVLGGLLPLLCAWFGFNPAVTSAPLMTTIVDSSGLIIYFYTAKLIMGI